jgi:hypothetical protein
MSNTTAILALLTIVTASNVTLAQTVVPGPGGPRVMPPQSQQYIPPSQGQYPIYVSPNEITGINPETGGYDTYNRQIDNTVYQVGRNESQNNGTKRWVRRPIHNAQGQVVGYQEGYVWINSITGQEHGELTNYTPNGLGGVNNQHQSRSVQGGGAGGVHRNVQSYSMQPAGGVHKNVQSKL